MRFGPWRWPQKDEYEQSWKAALARWHDFDEARKRGVVHKVNPRMIPVGDLVDIHLGAQHDRAEKGQIKDRSFAELRSILTEFRDEVGGDTTVGDLEADPHRVREYVRSMDRFGWCAFNKRMKLVRSLWNAAAENNGPLAGRPFAWLSVLAERPLKDFRRQRRREREAGESGSFEPDEIRAIIRHAPLQTQAMVLLGYFAALGNNDLGELHDGMITVSAQPQRIFLRGREEEIPAGWGTLYYPRPKTELDRYAMIPPNVVDVLNAARADRPAAKRPAYRRRQFLTLGGMPVSYEVTHRDESGLIKDVTRVDNVCQPWKRLLSRLGHCAEHGWQVRQPFCRDLDSKGARVRFCPACEKPMRPMLHRGFYGLRHAATTFATGSGASDDARKVFEGHVDRDNKMRQTFYLNPTQLHDLLLVARELLARVGLNESEPLRVVASAEP
jgi:hypothetical protein